MTKITIAIADDSVSYRTAIAQEIRLEKDFEVILEVDDGLDLLTHLEAKNPNVILMDIRMPRMNGIEATERIKDLYPNQKIIALSQYDIEKNIVEMNIHGVKSFVGKQDEPDELFKAIRIVHEGGVYMTERSAMIIQQHLKKGYEKDKKQSDSPIDEDDFIFLRMIVDGLTSREIGEKINRSHRTVEDMRDKLYRKYDVTNKQQLVILFTKWAKIP